MLTQGGQQEFLCWATSRGVEADPGGTRGEVSASHKVSYLPLTWLRNCYPDTRPSIQQYSIAQGL